MASNKKPKTINPDDVDPSVYYYDEVYDDMQQAQEDDKKIDKKAKQKEGSKYIQGISETSERRKAEKEIRKFKKYARDREEAQASGHLHDEEVYISKSYEKRLKEVHEVIKSQSKYNDDRAFNVFKKVKHNDDNKEVKHNDDDKELIERRSTETSLEPISAKKNRHSDTGESDVKNHTGSESETRASLANHAKAQRPTTIEERREYLRKVLAKRTVGEVFKAAQERYHKRKSKSLPSI